ncbi:MAG: hypothetical protein KGQ26_08115, partial [Rhodospirillales bacterium]|nr:hypothetical protein [Rhodospirillales bacterium]
GGFTNSGATSFRAALEHGAISKAANFAPAFLEQVAGDGLVGGLSSVAEGGNFESGFLAAGFRDLCAGSVAPARIGVIFL